MPERYSFVLFNLQLKHVYNYQNRYQHRLDLVGYRS